MKIWSLEPAIWHSQPKVPRGKQGQECQFPPFTSLNCPTDVDEKQDQAA